MWEMSSESGHGTASYLKARDYEPVNWELKGDPKDKDIINEGHIGL